MGRSYSQNGGDPQVFGGAEQLETFPCPQLQASVNNYLVAKSGFLNASLLLVSSTGNINLTGLVGGVPNRQLTLLNIGAHIITVKDTSGLSAAGNQFFLGGSDTTLAQWGAVTLIWSKDANAWVAAGGGGGGGGGGAPVNGTYWTQTDESLVLPNSKILAPTGALVRKALDQVIPHATRTAVTFDTALFDTDGFFNIATPTRLTAPATGLYTLEATGIYGAAVNGFAGLSFAINGDLTTLYGSSYVAFGTSGDPGPTPSITLQLAAADYIEVYAFQNSGGPEPILATSNSEACTFNMIQVH